jgi:hypothetical protein
LRPDALKVNSGPEPVLTINQSQLYRTPRASSYALVVIHHLAEVIHQPDVRANFKVRKLLASI